MISGANAAPFFGPGTLAGDDSVVDDSATRTDVNQIKSLRQVMLADGTTSVEIELTSNREMLPQGALLVLRIGEQDFSTGRYPQTGETGTVTFTLSAQEFGALQDGAPVTVQYGEGHDDAGWRFGRINKGQLAK